MSKPFITEQGEEAPKPVERFVHRFTDYSARYEPIECVVQEMRYPTFTLLTAWAKSSDTWTWVASEQLAAIAALRISQGMELVSITDLSAHLRPRENSKEVIANLMDVVNG